MRRSRRSFLTGIGAGLCAAPFVPLLESKAEVETPPTRLLLVFSPNGTIRERWKPTGSGTNYQLSEILAPLEPHRDDIVVLDGIGIPNVGPGVSHARGIASLWSGHTINPGTLFEGGDGNTTGWGGGITVDQYIANATEGTTPFKSLELAVQPGTTVLLSRMSYAGSDAPLPPESNPAAVFDRLFGNFGLGETEYQALKARRQSVIDVVLEDLHHLESRVSAADRVKMEAHLDAIRSIEKRLEVPPWGEACVPPMLDPVDHTKNPNYPVVVDQMTELLTMAMACGMTNIVTLQWSRAVSFTRFLWLGISNGHHDLSHEPDSNTAAIDALTAINTWYTQKFGELVQAFKNVPEGEGTMLDNTMIVWGNELARGNSHASFPIPFVVAGSAGGQVQTGRYLDVGEAQHSKLLLSILHAMGQTDVTSFGDMDPNPGLLPGLLS